jgi:hypothetical protein
LFDSSYRADEQQEEGEETRMIQNADSQADRGHREETVDKTHQHNNNNNNNKSEEERRESRPTRRIYKMFKNHDFCYSLEVAEEESEASL